VETIEDLRELMQDDIVCAMAGWSYGGGSIAAEDVNDCTSDLCNIVINRIEEFVNKEKKAKDT
tara:strand:+ start:129 stop:317 length:189 start_codon:yes stop_codon:yes gene_type:complete